MKLSGTRVVQLLMVAAGFALVSACSSVTVGNNFDLKAFTSKVQRGTTSQAQIRGWLGAPTGTGQVVDVNGQTFEEWSYYFASGRLPNLPDLEVKILQIKFDKHGVVQGFNWSGANR